jgi:hypothetical protein
MYILQVRTDRDDFVVGTYSRKRDAKRKALQTKPESLLKKLASKYEVDALEFSSYAVITLNKRGQTTKVETIA